MSSTLALGARTLLVVEKKGEMLFVGCTQSALAMAAVSKGKKDEGKARNSARPVQWSGSPLCFIFTLKASPLCEQHTLSLHSLLVKQTTLLPSRQNTVVGKWRLNVWTQTDFCFQNLLI